MDILRQVAATVNRYGMVTPADRLAVAVSGGADSVFLLHALHELYPGRLALVVHLNHGLRGSASDHDAAFVAGLAAALGLPCRTENADLSAWDRNLEQAGRKARAALFRKAIASGAATRVATGHTRSDQAETVLYRLLRGTAATGLRGILPVTAEGLIRPLLACERPDIEAWLRARSLPWREDATNADPAFERNRIRRLLLPAIAQMGWSQLPQKLARLAEVAADEELAWEQRVAETAGRLVRRTAGAILLPVSHVRQLDRALSRRLIRHLVRELKGDTRGLSFEHVESAIALFGRATGNGAVDLPGVALTRSFDWVRFDRSVRKWEWDCFALYATKLEVIDFQGATSQYNKDCSADAGSVPATATFRRWRPGDRIPLGHGRNQKLKEYFQQARVPVWERAGWPVLADGSAVIWAEGIGVAPPFRVTENTRRVLRIVRAPASEQIGR